MNMPDWFETTGDSYFKHINRTTIELAVAAARGSEAELSVRVAAKSGSENVEPLFDVRQLLLCPVRPCRLLGKGKSLPYGPAALPERHHGPDTCQHPTTLRAFRKNFLARTGLCLATPLSAVVPKPRLRGACGVTAKALARASCAKARRHSSFVPAEDELTPDPVRIADGKLLRPGSRRK